MDYCSSCRRSLNGALVCPGCGDYAPDIAPPTHRHRAPTAAATWEAWRAEEAAGLGAREGSPQPGTQPFDAAPFGSGASERDLFGNKASAQAVPADAADAGVADGSDGATATGQGRAARRRQLARWKKHRRRAVAATAFALVGGGLTASLLQNKPSPGHAQAASSPEPGSVGSPRTESAASASEQPDTAASRHPDTRPHNTAVRQQHTTPAAPPSSAPPRQAHSAAPDRPHISPSTAPHTAAPASTKKAPVDHTGVAAPSASTAPASNGSSDTGTPPAHPAPDTSTAPANPSADPTSPTHVCLLGLVCVN
ncbi:hypothetical protein ACFTZI_19465 [Streptomyces decoyicus]|uniref:SCO2400 family protein n=1 Tax=Streptomyces decoyicus TaxID=249567 RepID=UPI00363D808D